MLLSTALEKLALQSSRVGSSVDYIASTVALIYRDEICFLPWPSGPFSHRINNLTHEQMGKLVRLVIRDLQMQGRTILVERGLGDDDAAFDGGMSFAPGHALIVERAWQMARPSPVWIAFERSMKEIA